jgi:hypothetical protein
MAEGGAHTSVWCASSGCHVLLLAVLRLNSVRKTRSTFEPNRSRFELFLARQRGYIEPYGRAHMTGGRGGLHRRNIIQMRSDSVEARNATGRVTTAHHLLPAYDR